MPNKTWRFCHYTSNSSKAVYLISLNLSFDACSMGKINGPTEESRVKVKGGDAHKPLGTLSGTQVRRPT